MRQTVATYTDDLDRSSIRTPPEALAQTLFSIVQGRCSRHIRCRPDDHRTKKVGRTTQPFCPRPANLDAKWGSQLPVSPYVYPRTYGGDKGPQTDVRRSSREQRKTR